jgi:hypothetical protein
MSKKKQTEEATDIDETASSEAVLQDGEPVEIGEGDPADNAEDMAAAEATVSEDPGTDAIEPEIRPRGDTIYRTIQSPASDEEMLEAARGMVEEMKTLERLKDEKKTRMASYTGMIEECQERVNEFRETFETAVRSTKVECEWRIDIKGGRAHLHRIDNGEYVESRDATSDELQGILPLEGDGEEPAQSVADAIGQVFDKPEDEPLIEYPDTDRGNAQDTEETLAAA